MAVQEFLVLLVPFQKHQLFEQIIAHENAFEDAKDSSSQSYSICVEHRNKKRCIEEGRKGSFTLPLEPQTQSALHREKYLPFRNPSTRLAPVPLAPIITSSQPTLAPGGCPWSHDPRPLGFLWSQAPSLPQHQASICRLRLLPCRRARPAPINPASRPAPMATGSMSAPVPGYYQCSQAPRQFSRTQTPSLPQHWTCLMDLDTGPTDAYLDHYNQNSMVLA